MKKEEPSLSRAERRRILREQRKNEKLGLTPEDPSKPKIQRNKIRKLVLGITLLFAAAASWAMVRGGKIWLYNPIWLDVLGGMGILGILGTGLVLWARNKDSFTLKIGWLVRLTLAFVLGITMGYFYAHTFRQVGEYLDLRGLQQRHGQIIDMTSAWDGQSWEGKQCQAFEPMMNNLVDDVMGKELPPTGSAYRLVMSINQIGYLAGCDIDFGKQIQAVVDDNHQWEKSASWHYRSLRLWINQVGWPRVETGCKWEAKRAKIGGNDELSKTIEKMCNISGLKQLEAWNPGSYTLMAEQQLKIYEQADEEVQKLRQMLEEKYGKPQSSQTDKND